MSLEAWVRMLVWLHRLGLRHHLPLLLTLLTLGGSLIKANGLLPDTYFSNRRNVFNVYFVKLSWGWTMGLLLPFIFTSNYFIRKNIPFVLRRSSSVVVGTAIWFLCTRAFQVVENFTGKCYETQNMTVVPKFEHMNDCRGGGHLWLGFDISGHCFLLSYCALTMAEEAAVMNTFQKLKEKPGKAADTIIKSLFIALNTLLLLWVWMFSCTTVYFHDLPHKILGTAVGIAAWYTTYKVWYKKPFSPGLPLETENKRE